MIIEKLTFSNLRSYAGKHEIEFAQPGKRDVTIINGNNGAGKTSLFNILNWVLFGDRAEFDGHLIHQPLLTGGKSATGSALLEFTHDHTHYYLSRGVDAHEGADGEPVERFSPPELYTIDAGGNVKYERLVESKLDQILPAAIRTFFFFDGDRISDFTRPGKTRDEAITQAVNNLLNLENLRRAIAHLKSVSRDLNAEIRAGSSNPRIQAIEKQLQGYDQQIESLRRQQHDLAAELKAIHQRKAETDVKLAGFEDVKEKASKRALLEVQLREASSRIDNLHAQLLKEAARAAYLPLIKNRMNSAKILLDEKRKKREVPSNIRDQFLRDLLSQQVCICERPIETGSAEESHIRRLLQQILPGAIQDRAQTLAGQLGRLIKSRDERVGSINGLIVGLNEAVKDRDEISAQIKELGDEIKGNLAEEIRQLEIAREGLISAERGNAFRSGKMESDVDRLQREEKELRVELLRETEKVAALKAVTRRARLAVQAEDSFVRIQEKLEAGLRDDISTETTRIFSALIEKKDFFSKVLVGDDYVLSVLNQSGVDVRPLMSMGETQVLSLSFIVAMTAISEYQAPLVIDTPLARLDTMVRNNVVTNLPAQTNQLALLVTNSEMTADLRTAIDDRVGAEYRLEFVEAGTTISKGRS